MDKAKVLDVIGRTCYRVDGYVKAAMIQRKFWIKNGTEDVYDYIIRQCNHENPTMAQLIYHIKHDIGTTAICAYDKCDTQLEWSKITSSYPKYCSVKCSSSDPVKVEAWRQSNYTKYGEGNYGQGTEEAVSKRRVTNLGKYGYDSYSNTDEFKTLMSTNNPMHDPDTVRRQQARIIEIHGENAHSSDDFIKKRRETSIKRYGVEHHMQTRESRRLYTETNLERHGVPNVKYLHLSDDAREILTNPTKLTEVLTEQSIQSVSDEYGVEISTIYKCIQRYGLSHLVGDGKSQLEEVIYNAILEICPDVNVVRWDRTVLERKELDFYFPDYGYAIEINGTYWHTDRTKDRNYHYEKWKECRDAGISLLSYTTYDVTTRLEVIKDKIRYILKQNKVVVGARKCRIDEVNLEDEKRLLNRYHIQGYTKSRMHSIGAYYGDELVGVMSWNIRKQYLEITRYCTDTSRSYPGLFSKLLEEVKRITKYKGDIVSFSNNDHGNGNLYRSSGFELDKILPPSYWYTKDNYHLENRQNYTKSKIRKKFDIVKDDRTERQLMESLGYDRYYDSGKIRWILKGVRE